MSRVAIRRVAPGIAVLAVVLVWPGSALGSALPHQLTWTTQRSGTTANLTFVSFADQRTGWAVGALGTILHTTDGGATWSPQRSGTTDSLRGVHAAADGLHAWTVGGSLPTNAPSGVIQSDILATADGGLHWTAQHWTPLTGHATVPQNLIAVDFIDLRHGWAVGGMNLGASGTPVVLRTVDGGAHWDDVTPPGAAGYFLAAVDFIDANEGWASGGTINHYTGVVLHTSDGGTTWSPQYTSATDFLPAIAMVDATRGWVAGGTATPTGPALLQYDGATWTAQTAGVADGLRGLSAVDRRDAWAVSDRGYSATSSLAPSGNSEVLATADGRSWAPGPGSSSTDDLQSVDFIDQCHGWAVGNNGVIRAATCPTAVPAADASTVDPQPIVDLPSTSAGKAAGPLITVGLLAVMAGLHHGIGSGARESQPLHRMRRGKHSGCRSQPRFGTGGAQDGD